MRILDFLLPFLTADFLGKPAWVWLTFVGVVIALIFSFFAIPRKYQHRVLFWGILGLRALYFALAAMIHRFKVLKYALALVLVFIGSKIFLVGMIGKIPAVISLSVTFGLIAGGALVSLWKSRGQPAVVEPT